MTADGFISCWIVVPVPGKTDAFFQEDYELIVMDTKKSKGGSEKTETKIKKRKEKEGKENKAAHGCTKEEKPCGCGPLFH